MGLRKFYYIYVGTILTFAFFSILYDIRKMSVKKMMKDINRHKLYKELIEEQGYSFEEHKIVTEDGYINTAWRIRSKEITTFKQVPIIVCHGLLDNSYTFLALNKEFSLVYNLVNEGYDIWMVNTRGSTFSFEHMEEDKDSFSLNSEYWNFTFYEIAKYDLKAHISYVKEITNQPKVNYIGHSQGAFQMLLGYTLFPEFIEESISHFVSIGTVAKFIEIERSFPLMIKDFKLFEIFQFFGIGNIMGINEYNTTFNDDLCRYFLWICKYVISTIIELKPTNEIDYNDIIELYQFEPGGTSVKNLIHWLQTLSTHSVSLFDYGEKENKIKYGKEKPKTFDVHVLGNIGFKVLFIKGKMDPYIPPKSINYMKELIPQAEFLEVENYNHLDYIWARSAKYKVNVPIINFLNK